MSTNLKQLAKLLGLSTTTVSRALAGYPDVSEVTRRRVRAEAKAHGYQPNPVARRLQKGRTEAIGIILPPGQNYFSDTFFTELLGGISETMAIKEHDLVLTVASDMENESQAMRRMVEGKRVDGVILVQSRLDDPRIRYLQEQQFPFVVYGRTESETPYAFIDVNGTRAFREATDFLIELGHRRIALINGPSVFYFPKCCAAGYRQALQAAQIEWDDSLVCSTQGTSPDNGGYLHTLELMRLPDPPTGLLCFTEAAPGVFRALSQLNLQAGQDVSVIGYDDLELARYSAPPLTTLRPPVREIGRRLIEILISLIGGGLPENFQEIREAHLTFRQSTGVGPRQRSFNLPASPSSSKPDSTMSP